MLRRIRRVLREYLFERGYCLSKSEFTAFMMAFSLIGLLLGAIFKDNLIYAFIFAGALVVLTIIMGEPIPRRDKEE